MKLSSLVSSLVLSTCLFASAAKAEVWTAVNEWNDQWEQGFAEWVAKNWTADFFARQTLPNGQSNPYYGIRADCADTVYSMRLIYSYENKLPFGYQDPTTTERVLISNRMSRWNKYADEFQRLRSFLNYTYSIVSTYSLPNDTYPVAIGRDTIHSGGLIRTTSVNHHSWTIKEIQVIGVPHLIFNSTVGSNSGPGLQERVSWPNPAWVFEGNFTPESEAGFRYWRPMEFINLPTWEVPGYSEEQFTIPLDQWQKTIQKKLALRHETEDQLMRRLSQTVCESAKTRVTSVNDGVNYLHTMPANTCMDFGTYDTYSTPNRDQRLFDDIAALRRAYKDVLKSGHLEALTDDMRVQLNKVFPLPQSTAKDETAQMPVSQLDGASWCVVEYAPGKKIDLAEIKRRLFKGQISNNPLDDLEYRWGSLAGPSPLAQSCESWDPWTPDLKQAD